MAETADAASRVRTHYLHLGATLYMPATRADLAAVMNGLKLHGVRSVVACTEDAVRDDQVGLALRTLETTLANLGPGRGPLRFVRPRSPAVLADVLALRGVRRLDGVCLPKLDSLSLPGYLEVLAAAPWLQVMPILETEEAFDPVALLRLRRRLEGIRERVLCIRVGGNDLLQLLGMKRPAHLSAYDTPLRTVLDQIQMVFRPAGFEVAAPVFEHLERPDVLAAEVHMDALRGFFAKTAIHPSQIATIEAAYAVHHHEAELAEAVLTDGAAGVFRLRGQMVEPATHGRWAQQLLARRCVYGCVADACPGQSAA